MARSESINFLDLLNRPQSVATMRLSYGADADQFGELWLPAGSGPHPVVVMIHGGCWKASLPGLELMSPIAEDLRKSGFAVWNIEYRRLGNDGAGYPGTFLDIAHGVDYLRQIGAAYGLDVSHITIIGHSAGGQLALWAAARSHIDHASPIYVSDPLPVAAVTTLAGINDLEAYHDRGPNACGGPNTIEQLIDLQKRAHQNPYADTSPAVLLPLHIEQQIVSGELDPIVPLEFGHDYARLAIARGDRVNVLDIKDAGHFELIDPHSNAWVQIKQTLIMKMP